MEPLCFETREEFREWLEKNGTSHDGIWLLFCKTKAIKTIKAQEALEEALCFGWIDGLMKSKDENTYIKYFSKRRSNSVWSLKNKKLAEELEKQGLMKEHGRAQIVEAKKNGRWDEASKPSAISSEQIAIIMNLLKEHPTAYENFNNMSLSVQKTYTRAYLDAKTDAGRVKRFEWMLDRLNKNLKPM